jgi:hypothetical protein
MVSMHVTFNNKFNGQAFLLDIFKNGVGKLVSDDTGKGIVIGTAKEEQVKKKAKK